jgi:CBS-domain-containing membrane protein
MGDGGNVIAELTTDHREADELFAKIEALPVGDEQRLVGMVAQAEVARALPDPQVGDLLEALSTD